MAEKCFISITGTTCVGKSTLLKSVMLSTQDIFVIPQVTTRQARSDDIPELIKYVDVINEDDMFLCNRELSYGIRKDDINRFLLSKKQFAIAINGTDEIEMIKSKHYNDIMDYKNILLTFTHNEITEIEKLSQQLAICFSEENYNKRMLFYSQHIKNKLLNPDFICNNIDVHLTREMSVSDWSLQMAQLLKINPFQLYKCMQNEIKEHPKLKQYIHPLVKEGISGIILSLQHNKK